MDGAQVIEALVGSGPFGIICAILIWRDIRRDEREEAREIRREAMEDKRIEADRSLTAALVMLTERVGK